MKWILRYQLFLFDFDGLLVDTERLHYQSYVNMCAEQGFQLNWSFERFCKAAHHTSTGLRDQIYAEFPDLHKIAPDWQVLYEKKKRHFLDLIENGTVTLLPGVTELLLALKEANIQRCVVTHSPALFINHIRHQNPILNTIPHWITRENYQQPKPHPECYQLAIDQFAQPHDQIIGFEDSLRGLRALIETKAKPVLICSNDDQYLNLQHPHVSYYSNFNAIHEENAP